MGSNYPKEKEINMNQRTALVIATVLTAFALFIGGAVAGRIVQPAVNSPAATIPPEVQAGIQQREAAYQEMIRQANERLAQANANQLIQVTPTDQPATPLAPSPQIAQLSSIQAASVAFQVAPGANLMSMPELVNYQGATAYEVILNMGVVYVDANSGQILYNGTAAMIAQPSFGEHEDHDD
jgi:hypothetical protein